MDNPAYAVLSAFIPEQDLPYYFDSRGNLNTFGLVAVEIPALRLENKKLIKEIRELKIRQAKLENRARATAS